MTALDAALGYAARGWPVLRVAPGGKNPNIGAAWQKQATTDVATIGRWFAEQPDANVGLLCGVAFDVLDVEEAGRGPLAEWLVATGRTVPEGPLVATGRDGFHLYLAASGRPKADLFLDGLRIGELRTANHQVLAPPSRTVGEYRWLLPPEDELSPVPAWIDELVRARPAPARREPFIVIGRGARSLDALARTVARTAEGNRNFVLFWAARRAAKEGHPEGAIHAALMAAAMASGLDRRAADATIASGIANRDTIYPGEVGR